MKKILSLLMLSLGLSACNSCSKDPVVVPIPSASNTAVTPPVNEKVVQRDSFRFILPSHWIQQEATEAYMILYADPAQEALVMLSYFDSLLSYDEFVLYFIRELKDNGGEIVQSSTVVINNHTYTYLMVNKDNMRAHMWLTIYQGKSYQFTCGAKVEDVQTMCTRIANSLHLR